MLDHSFRGPSPTPPIPSMKPVSWFPDVAASYHVNPDLTTLPLPPNIRKLTDQLHIRNELGVQISHIGVASLHSLTAFLKKIIIKKKNNVLLFPHMIKKIYSLCLKFHLL